MNSFTVLFCFLAMSVMASEAFNFLGGYDGDKKWNTDGRGSFWDMGTDHHNQPPGHGSNKQGQKNTDSKTYLEELITRSMYAQFKAYMMMADSYRMLGQSVQLQRIALSEANGGTLGGRFRNAFLGSNFDRFYSK
ncbi:uncharacterized protein LOC115230163 [Argonauta hians]